MKHKFAVYSTEYERGWGQRPFSVSLHDTYEEADAERERINAENTAPTAPDWYVQAEDVKSVLVDENNKIVRKL